MRCPWSCTSWTIQPSTSSPRTNTTGPWACSKRPRTSSTGWCSRGMPVIGSWYNAPCTTWLCAFRKWVHLRSAASVWTLAFHSSRRHMSTDCSSRTPRGSWKDWSMNVRYTCRCVLCWASWIGIRKLCATLRGLCRYLNIWCMTWWSYVRCSIKR